MICSRTAYIHVGLYIYAYLHEVLCWSLSTWSKDGILLLYISSNAKLNCSIYMYHEDVISKIFYNKAWVFICKPIFSLQSWVHIIISISVVIMHQHTFHYIIMIAWTLTVDCSFSIHVRILVTVLYCYFCHIYMYIVLWPHMHRSGYLNVMDCLPCMSALV